MTTFRYDPAIIERFPDVVGGVILAEGMTNGPTPESLQATYLAEQQAVLQKNWRDAAESDSVACCLAWGVSQVWAGPDAISQRGGGAAAPADQKGRYSQHQCAGGHRQSGKHSLRAAGSRL